MYYTIKPKTVKEHKTIQKLCFAKGIVWGGIGNEIYNDTSNHIQIQISRKEGNCLWCSDEGKKINLSELKKLLSKFKDIIEPKELRLNSNYCATVDYENKIVEVGCQTFTFKKIHQLARLCK